MVKFQGKYKSVERTDMKIPHWYWIISNAKESTLKTEIFNMIGIVGIFLYKNTEQ